jgi:Uma2 family endonuclease
MSTDLYRPLIDSDLPPSDPFYPESDGLPMADNAKQFRYIVVVKSGLDWLFTHDPNLFIAGDLLWYPVEGNNKIRTAPDVLVAFGRPKGHRRSYLQWREGGINPQVVFEIMSPHNTVGEMTRKFQFYERHGVEEYYVYDPDHFVLEGWLRRENALVEIENMNGWVSPRLGLRFEVDEEGLKLYRPDGQRFLEYEELARLEEEQRQHAEEQRQRAEEQRQRAEEQRQRAEKLAAQLRALGVEPEA